MSSVLWITKRSVLVLLVFLSALPSSGESNLKITGIAGLAAPDIPLADTTRPDVVLDPALSGEVNVDISTTDIPDGTKVNIKFKDGENINPPGGILEAGMVTIPVNLTAGAVKVLYAETDPYFAELASFSPLNIPKLKLWLKADEGVKANSVAADFTRANNQYLYIDDNPSISLGDDQDFSIALWVKLASKNGQWNQTFISKDSGGGDGRLIEYAVSYRISEDRFRLLVGNKNSLAYVDAEDIGSPEIGKWYFIAAWHDSENDTLNIQVNNKEINSIPWAGGTFDATSPLLIGDGSRNFQSEPEKFYLDGSLQGISFWKKVLAPSERAALYNSGIGKLYTDLDDEEKVNLIAWWDLKEKEGIREDIHGGHNLTAPHGVGFTDGIISGSAVDEEGVNKWVDSSGNGNTVLQLTTDYQPIYKANLLNGKGALKFDGSNDKLEASDSVTDLTQKITTYFVASQDKFGSDVVWSTKRSYKGDGCEFTESNDKQVLRWSNPEYKIKTSVEAGKPAYYTGVVRATNYATGTVTWRVNGKEIGTLFADRRSSSHDDDLTVGARPNNSKRFDGNIYEILIFEGEHTPQQVAQVESYLKTKYGL